MDAELEGRSTFYSQKRVIETDSRGCYTERVFMASLQDFRGVQVNYTSPVVWLSQPLWVMDQRCREESTTTRLPFLVFFTPFAGTQVAPFSFIETGADLSYSPVFYSFVVDPSIQGFVNFLPIRNSYAHIFNVLGAFMTGMVGGTSHNGRCLPHAPIVRGGASTIDISQVPFVVL